MAQNLNLYAGKPCRHKTNQIAQKKKQQKNKNKKKKTRDFYEATNRALVQVTLTAHDFNRDK